MIRALKGFIMNRIKFIVKILALAVIILCCLSTGVSAKEFKSKKTDRGGGYAVTKQIENTTYAPIMLNNLVGYSIDANYIISDRNGYIWVGTYSGIMRYDGSAFEIFNSADGFTSGRILFEDSKGRIWIGTNGDGVMVYINQDDHRHFGYEDGLHAASIRSFAEDNDGRIFVGTTDGIYYTDESFKFSQLGDTRLRNERVLRMCTAKDGKIYGITKTGNIFLIEDGVVSSYYRSKALGSAKITSIYPDDVNEGKIYLGTGDGELYYGDFGNPVWRMKEIEVNGLNSVKWIISACDRIWLASSERIGYLDTKDRFTEVTNLPMNDGIEMLTADYQGNIWVASTRQGLMKIVTSNFLNVNSRVGMDSELASSCCFIDDYLYIGTDSGIKIIYMPAMKAVESDPIIDFVGRERIRCLRRDSKDNLWVSTYNKEIGVVCYSKDKTIKNYTIKDGLPSTEIRNTYEAADGRILVGTSDGLAVISDNVVERVYSQRNGLTDPVLIAVGDGFDGEYYLGTDGGGIYVIKDKKVSRISMEDGLTSMVIQRIKRDDKNGVVWVFTSNSVQYIKDGKVHKVSTIPFIGNFDMFHGDDDTLWLLSAFGLCRIHAEDALNDSIEEYREYTVNNGLTSTPIRNAYNDMADDGSLYISSADGVNRVNIYDYTDNNIFIKSGIKAVYCDNVALIQDKDGGYTIPPAVSRIRIEPSIMDYSLSDPLVHIELEGADDNGITSRRSADTALEFTNLNYGSYKLHIQILDNETRKVLQDDTFRIVKLPGLFERTSVRIFIALLIMLSVALVVWAILRFTIIQRQYREIRVAKDEADRASTAKSRFLANMSHEIRTPINTIMGMNEIMLREDHENVPAAYYTAIVNYGLDIKSAAESLLGLINDILDISKIESGKMHLVEQEWATVNNLRAIVSMVRVRSSEKDLFFKVDIDENLPKKLYGDVGKIKQIVLNILTNAVKYTEKGGFTLSVSVTKIENDVCSLRFSVKDTGIGVKEEDMKKIFNAYERLDEEKNSSIQGTGLGLDISKRFAELMDGNLWCESVYGEGSDFILTIDQKIVDKEPIGVFTEHEDNVSGGPYVPKFISERARILVVDDNAMNLSVMRGLLKAMKVQVTTAESGEECLEILKKENFEIILLDHMMPGMDGLETLEKIRELLPDQIVFALTANVEPGGEDFYVSKGFNGYLSKPVDTVKLEEALYNSLPEELIDEVSADEAPKTQELPEEYLWIIDVEGISVEDGVRCSGGYDLFINSISMFRSTIEINASVLEKAFSEEDYQLYTVKVHALKSSARIIGANELSRSAEALEMAGKKNDIDFIKANHGSLMEEYLRFKDTLDRLGKEKKDDEDDKEPISEDELRDAYEALKEVIPQMDYDAVETILEDVTRYSLPEKDSEIIEEIRKNLKLFDWEKLEEIINEIQDGLRYTDK